MRCWTQWRLDARDVMFELHTNVASDNAPPAIGWLYIYIRLLGLAKLMCVCTTN